MNMVLANGFSAAIFYRVVFLTAVVMGSFWIDKHAQGEVIRAVETDKILGTTLDQPDSKLFDLLQEAKRLIATGDVTAAFEQLKPLATSPKVSDVDVLMADLFFSLGRSHEGQQWLERASVSEPKRLAIYLAFCELAVRQQRWFDGWNLSQLGERISAPKHWSPRMTQRVRRRLTILKAVCSEGRSDWTGARQTYESLIDDIEKDSDLTKRNVLLGLARSCVQVRDRKSAVDSLTTLSKYDPRQAPLHLLAQMYEQSDMIAEANLAYQQNVTEAGDETKETAKLAYARFLLFNNESEKAAPLLSSSVESDPEGQRAMLQAVLARMQGRMGDARSLFSKIHRDRPDSVVAANHLSAILVEEQDEAMRARALQIAESMVRNAPKSADGWAALGWVQLRLGDKAAAEASLVQSLKLGKPTRDTLYFVAKLKRATGKPKEAEAFERLFSASKGPDFFSGSK